MKDPWTIILPVLWAEFDRAVEKHPDFPGEQAAIAIIAEELGELAREINDRAEGWKNRAFVEAAHVAVTAIRTMEKLEV